jgi:hypothetical protein
MPRIAAAIAVFVLISFSIGLNISRYPMVWEMVGASGDLSQPEETASLQTTTQTAEPEPVATKAKKRKSPTATKTAVEKKEPVEKPEAIEDVARDNGYRPCGSRRLSDPRQQNDPLVPVSEPATGKVRRLPPVDPNSTAPAETHVSRTSQGPIPFYPTTGI